MTAESLSLGGAQRINRNYGGTSFNTLEKAATENNLTHLEIFTTLMKVAYKYITNLIITDK